MTHQPAPLRQRAHALFGAFLAASALVSLVAGSAYAQAPAWPAKQVRIIVATPPGNAPDIAARAVADKLGALWGQQVLVDNRPGAGGIVAMEAVRQSPADGYTLFLAHASVVTVTPYTFKTATYDVDRDLVPLSVVGVTPMMIAANPGAPMKNLAEAIAYAKANPDRLSVGNPTRTSIPHLAIELITQSTGAKFFNVPFSGSAPMVTASVNGDTMMSVDGAAVLLPMVKAGKLKAIAVTSEKVLPGLEGYALAKDALPGYEVYGWFSLFAPKGTPAAVNARINEDMNKALGQGEVITRLATFGTYPRPGTLAEAAAFVKKEQTVWSKVIRDAGIKAE